MAFDAFLKIDGIDGESTDSKHTNWVDVQWFEHSAEQPNTGSVGTRSSERVNPGGFLFRHEVDKSSTKLQIAMHSGSYIASAELEVCKATGDKQVFYAVKLENVTVGSVKTVTTFDGTTAHGAEGNTPVEEVLLWPGKITWTYTETDHKTGKAKGNLEGHWDYEENTGG